MLAPGCPVPVPCAEPKSRLCLSGALLSSFPAPHPPRFLPSLSLNFRTFTGRDGNLLNLLEEMGRKGVVRGKHISTDWTLCPQVQLVARFKMQSVGTYMCVYTYMCLVKQSIHTKTDSTTGLILLLLSCMEWVWGNLYLYGHGASLQQLDSDFWSQILVSPTGTWIPGNLAGEKKKYISAIYIYTHIYATGN